VFSGVGKLKDYQLKIHIDPEVTPVAQPPRRVPFHVRKQVEAKLTELQDLDIIMRILTEYFMAHCWKPWSLRTLTLI